VLDDAHVALGRVAAEAGHAELAAGEARGRQRDRGRGGSGSSSSAVGAAAALHAVAALVAAASALTRAPKRSSSASVRRT
jgi:hypothetical protein